jgi:hypothetical protein
MKNRSLCLTIVKILIAFISFICRVECASSALVYTKDSYIYSGKIHFNCLGWKTYQFPNGVSGEGNMTFTQTISGITLTSPAYKLFGTGSFFMN